MNKNVIVLRVNSYKGYDFVEEHNRVIADEKVWVLKLGKLIPEWRLIKIKEERGFVVFRTDKKHGSRFYIAKLVDYRVGEPNDQMIYPKYYSEMIDDLSYSMDISDSGTWLQVERIYEMSSEQINALVMNNSNEKVSTLFERCSSSFVYAHFEKEDILNG